MRERGREVDSTRGHGKMVTELAGGEVGKGREGCNFTFNQHRVISFYCAAYQTRLPNTSTPTQAIFIHPTKHEGIALY
jgi:hypothetical protein